MAEIKVTACGSYCGGPMVVYDLHARLKDRPYPDGSTTKVLVIKFGADTVEVWPADPDKILALAGNLAALAEELRGKSG